MNPVFADFHNHIIPGVDDGAVDAAEAHGALDAFLRQNITVVIATPHIEASLTHRPPLLAERLAQIDLGWAALQQIQAAAYPEMKIFRGAEIMLDTPAPLLKDERLRLAGSAYALVEYPYMRVPPNSDGVLHNMVNAGIIPIIAHPERYLGVTPDSELPPLWKRAGAHLQVNAGSLTGRYGTAARSNALALLERGLADYLCSDYHARGEPTTSAARHFLAGIGGEEIAEIIAGINPRRLVEGEPPLPAPPLRSRNMLDRLRRWLP